MHTFKEITNDHGIRRTAYARDNDAEYIITSARAKDMLTEYQEKYDQHPTAKWFNKHINFERIK